MTHLRTAIALLGWLFVAGVALADAPAPRAAVASAHPLATEAGHEIFAEGGNAFDAAVAVSAALGVVEPYSSGLGGGGLWLLYRASDSHYTMVDGRETAPAAATHDMYLDANGDPVPRASLDGPLAAAVPGLPAALVHMAREYGSLPLAELLEPAVRLAREGFPADERLLLGLRYKRELMQRWADAARVFLRDGEPPAPGASIVQPELARTLERIGEQGAEGFYRGEFAAKLVAGVRAAGGIWTLDDLARYRIVEREPVVGHYKGLRIVSAPPPSSGGIVLINALNILEAYELGRYPQPLQHHLVVEAMRRAFRDRAEYLGDPDYVQIPIERLLHPYYAAGQRASIRLDRATPSEMLPGILSSRAAGMQTTHFSVLDAKGNRVAGTQTINTWYGSGFMAPGTGVLLNNEMDDFSVKPGVPNAYELVGADANSIAPGKRPLSSMTPTFLESERGVAILGTPGGSRIISMVLLGTLTFASGGDAVAMVNQPRYHHQYLPDEIAYETEALGAEDVRVLRELGHAVKESSRLYGNMQAITWDYRSGEVVAGSDPRGVGAARVSVY